MAEVFELCVPPYKHPLSIILIDRTGPSADNRLSSSFSSVF